MAPNPRKEGLTSSRKAGENRRVNRGIGRSSVLAELPPPQNRKGGWYPDPEGSGRLRWWGGKEWSDRFMDASVEAMPGASDAADKDGSSTEAGPPKRRGQWMGAPGWGRGLRAVVAGGAISALAGANKS